MPASGLPVPIHRPPRRMRQAAACALASSALAAGALLAAAPARAESLRCAGGSVAEGDSRLALLYRCGAPVLADSHCAPAVLGGWPVPTPYLGSVVPCLVTEDWLYERGPGQLVATVRLRDGVVRAIVYGRPR